MARTTASGAVEAIQRQVRRVRRRHNLRELQRVLYLLSALGTGAATALVILALAASPHLFARAVVAIAAVTLGAALIVVRDARRRWIPGAAAGLWIDRQGGLTGRLATLVELGRGGDADAPLLPLLVEQNVARLALWRADRLVPRQVPRAALAMAAGGAALFALVVALAPHLRPRAPEVAVGEVPGLPLEGVEVTRDRVAVAPLDPEDDDAAAAPGAVPDEWSAVAQLRERIRRDLWGAPTRESPAPVARTQAREAAPADGADEAAGESGLEPAPSPTARASPEDRTSSDARQAAAETQSIEDGAHGLLEQPRDGDDESAAAGGAAAGAGSQPDPNLFGPPTRGAAGTSQRFALSLAARMHAGRGGPGEGATPPSPPAAGARTDLAPGQRTEAAVQRMPVPLAYEALVRRLFAHEGLP